MADEPTNIDLIEPIENEVHPEPEDAPTGCFALWGSIGMAAYAFLVLGMACTGLVGLTSSSVMMLWNQRDKGAELISGAEAESWRLSELRGVGILGAEDYPIIYHDHAPGIDGSAGCMVVDDTLISWEEWTFVAKVSISRSVLTQEGSEEAPTLTLSDGTAEVVCPFGEGEGGDRMVRMMRAEIREAQEK